MKSEIKFYWRLLLRRLPWMLPIVILCTALGVVQAVRLPAIYETQARLLVEAPQISDDLVNVIVETSAEEEISIIRERLLTRANLLDIADEFDVFVDYSEMTPDTIVERMQDNTNINSQGGRDEATLIRVSFAARSGQIAADVVNEYVTRILAANVEQRRETASGTRDFFEQEVQRLSEELGQRSARISQFQAENADALPEDQQFRLGRQALLQERIGSATRELSTLIDQRARIIEIYESTGQVSAADQILTDDQRQLRDLERELAQQLTTYSENAPQVITLRRRIDTLREQVNAAAPADGPVNSGQAVLDLQLDQIDAQIGTLEAVMAEAEAELTRLQDAIARTPQVSITLSGMERDYENIRIQYDRSVASLAEASTGQQIELTNRGQRITLVESANVPAFPSRPNRKLIAAAGGVLGVGIVSLLFAAIEVLNRTIRRPVEINRAFGIEPLAALPHISTRAERMTRFFGRLTVLLLVCAGLPALLWAVDTHYIPLDQLANDLLGRLGLG